jgi:acetyltransferase-like isoleucine patch superfamily enzyme
MSALLTYPVRAWLGLAGRWRDASQRRHCATRPGARILPQGSIVNQQRARDAINLGANSWIAGQLLVYAHAGRIDIGDFCYVGENSKIWSAQHVAIGHRVFLAHGVNVHDNDAHSLSAKIRHEHFRELVTLGQPSFVEDFSSAPIRIEDDVWIGFNSTILKGTHIGRGAIVGACSLVTRDVEAFAIVAGNPAVVVGQAKP